MKAKRTRALRRRAMRKVFWGLLLIGLLAVETLAMAQIGRGLYRAPAPPSMTIDPGLCLRGW